MACSSRTTFATLSLLVAFAGVTACGHFGIELVGAEGDLEAGTGVDGGAGEDGSINADGATDASPDARDGGGPLVCAGSDCPGVYVAGTDGVGNDTNPGTSDKPVGTIQKGIELAAQRTGSAREVYVAAKAGGLKYAEKITLVDGVSLFGGYGCAALPCTWARDLTGNSPTVTILNATDYDGLVVGDTISRATIIDGFWIYGKSGAPDSTLGTIAVTFDGGSATVRDCRIEGGQATSGNAGFRRSIAVGIFGPTKDPNGPLLQRNIVRSAPAAEESIGILVGTRVSAPANSTVSATIVDNNNIRSGAAPTSIGMKVNAGSDASLFEGNTIASGPASGVAVGSWAIVLERVAMTIHRNRINAEAGSTSAGGPSCTGDGALCGGLSSVGSSATITSNIIRGSRAGRAAAVLLAGGEGGSGVVILNGNTLDPAGSEPLQGTFSSAIVVTNATAANLAAGNVRNNILLGGSNFARYGVYELNGSGKTAHLAHLENNDFFNPGRQLVGSDFAYHFYDGLEEKDYLFGELNNVTPTPIANKPDNPLLDSTFHLQAGSPVIDKGTPTEAPKYDFDGDARMKGNGIDIGADER